MKGESVVSVRSCTSRQINFSSLIAQQRAGEQARFDEDLKAVADAKHESALGREFLHGLHDGRKARDGAAAQIIAVGEPAGKDDRIHVDRGRWNRAR